MKRLIVLTLIVLGLLLILPSAMPARAQATSTPTATNTATSTATASATANIWYYATTEAGQAWQLEYSATLGDVLDFIIRSIIIALALAGLVLVLHERK